MPVFNNVLRNALTTHFVKQGMTNGGRILGAQTFSPTHRIQQAIAPKDDYKSYNKVKKSAIRKRGIKSTIKTPPLPNSQVPGLTP